MSEVTQCVTLFLKNPDECNEEGALVRLNGYFRYFKKCSKDVEVFSKLFFFCGFQALRILDTICSLLNWKELYKRL